jgi:TatD DNase family protein
VTDCHAHLDACDEPAEALIARAHAAGVGRIVTIGTGIDSCRRALAIAEAHDGVVAALGIDPHQASSPEAERIAELSTLLDHPKAVAVGETGLDGFHTFATIPDQRQLFEAQLALAEERSLPVVIHSREAEEETQSALASFNGTVILHCFSSPGLLRCALDRGYYVSYAGNVTFPKAEELLATVVDVPANRLLAETDSPYLAPQPVRGRRNEPANVLHTLAVLARERGSDVDELAATIDENARLAFGLA